MKDWAFTQPTSSSSALCCCFLTFLLQQTKMASLRTLLRISGQLAQRRTLATSATARGGRLTAFDAPHGGNDRNYSCGRAKRPVRLQCELDLFRVQLHQVEDHVLCHRRPCHDRGSPVSLCLCRSWVTQEARVRPLRVLEDAHQGKMTDTFCWLRTWECRVLVNNLLPEKFIIGRCFWGLGLALV